jgi:hypothetical protein
MHGDLLTSSYIYGARIADSTNCLQSTPPIDSKVTLIAHLVVDNLKLQPTSTTHQQ